MIKLLTLNALMRHGVRPRLRALAALLERGDHDVVCLQEVMFRAHARLVRGIARSFGYHACSGAVLLHGGLVVLARRPITAARFIPYQVTKPLRPELVMRKGIQRVRVDTADGPLDVLHTHLSANRLGTWSSENVHTRRQRAELARLATAVGATEPGIPVIVAGDLNVPRGSHLLDELLRTAGLRDPRAGDPEPTYRPTARFPTPPAFDHVLPGPGAGVAATRLVFQDAVELPHGRRGFLSDHYGLEADITR